MNSRGVLAFAWVVALVLVNPLGEFPINDDWSYAAAVRSLVEDGRWQLNHWTSMPLATHVLWGSAFTLPFGFSFMALRLSTMAMGALAALGLYQALRLCDASRLHASLAAGTFAFCPLVFASTFTFMTDVPFAALSIWAVVFLLRHVESNGRWDLIALVGLVVVATLLRQTGLAVGVGAAGALCATKWRTASGKVAALALIALPAMALLAYGRFLDVSGKPAMYDLKEDQLLAVGSQLGLSAFAVALNSAGISYLYAGLFAIPLLGLTLRSRGGWSRPRSALAGSLTVLAMACLAYQQQRMPLIGNVFHDLGLNPVLVAGRDTWPRAPELFWSILTLLSAFSAAAMFSWVAAGARAACKNGSIRARAALTFSAVTALGYMVPLCFMGGLIDRYLILPFGLLLMALAAVNAFTGTAPLPSVAACAALLAMMAGFDVAATHDFFAFSRARWAAVADLTQNGVPPTDIDGGFEVNGWLSDGSRPAILKQLDWRTASHGRMLVALGPVDHYRQVATYPFSRWMGASPGQVFILRRED